MQNCQRSSMKEAVIIGAGRLGKGFVGETLANSPTWKMTFIDADPVVIKKLNENGSYYVTVHREDRVENHTISDFQAFTWEDESVNKKIINTDLILFVIYPEKIPEAINSLIKGIKQRYIENPEQNLSLIFLTNKNHMMNDIHNWFYTHLDETERLWFNRHIVLRDSIIRRSTDAEDNTSLHIRTTAVLSLLIQKPLNVDISDIEWLEVTDQLELLKEVKVFIVNGPHAASAFMGYYAGYETINQISNDPKGAAFIAAVEKEIKAGIMAQFPLTEEQLDNLSVFPTAKGNMIDYIYRVAYDPIRKLSKGDRLSGSAQICYENNLPYHHIAKAIAYGFLYDNPSDPQAISLQKRIQKEGLSAVIEQITGFSKNHEVYLSILKNYEHIKNHSMASI